jgi:hypothetical protein
MKDWVLRLFGTIWGMIIVNSFNLYKYQHMGNPTNTDFNGYIGQLAYQLIFNRYLDEEKRLRKRHNIDEDYQREHTQHYAAKLSSLP